MPKSSNIIETPIRKQTLAVISMCILGICLLYLVSVLSVKNNNGGEIKLPAYANDNILATLDDFPIYQSQVDYVKSFLSISSKSKDQKDSQISNDAALQYIIQQKLLAKAARATSLNEETLLKMQIQFQQDQILADAMVDNYLKTHVTEDAIRNHYEAEKRINPPGIQIKARQIVVPDSAGAMEIVRRLENGDAFATLALAYSTDRASRESGGDMGYLNPDMLEPVFREKLFSGKDGERLDIFQTSKGWHVVDILARRKAPIPSFEDRKDKIATLLQAKKLSELMQKLKADATIQTVNTPPELHSTEN